MATKKRRLGDLYITGREFKINDESGEEPVVVWLQKLNAIESEQCFRRAGAARSQVHMKSRDKESLDYQDIYSDVLEYERPTLLSIVLSEEVAEINSSVEAELAAEEEWSKEGYLQGLRDSWAGDGDKTGLRIAFENGESDENFAEAKKVLDEMTRFMDLARKRADNRIESAKREYENVSIDELRAKAVERNVSLRADSAWITEYRRSQLYYGVRDPENHKKRYFESRAEVDELSAVVLDQLSAEFEGLMVSTAEGKDLPPTPDSSPPQEQRDEVETAASSGPEVANQ